MKTKLVINDDLKVFLHAEKNRATEHTLELERIYKRDSFDWQWLFRFDNGLGASVVKFFGSFGFDDDLFELAVIDWYDDEHFGLNYDTEITDNVIGYLTNDEVMDLLYKIRNIVKGETKNEN